MKLLLMVRMLSRESHRAVINGIGVLERCLGVVKSQAVAITVGGQSVERDQVGGEHAVGDDGFWRCTAGSWVVPARYGDCRIGKLETASVVKVKGF